MKKSFETIQNNPLFDGIAYSDFVQVLNCLSIREAHYGKNEVIILAGDDVTFIGLIASGGVRIIKEDERGHVSMLTEIPASGMFGEILACAGISQSPVTITATEDTEIIRIDSKKVLETCDIPCVTHKRLMGNLLRLMAEKNIMLNRKIEMISMRTIREKLLCFLEFHADGANTFTVPYTREEMAQYLCVDRSAMSNELCKMEDEGLIKFHRNSFELLG